VLLSTIALDRVDLLDPVPLSEQEIDKALDVAVALESPNIVLHLLDRKATTAAAYRPHVNRISAAMMQVLLSHNRVDAASICVEDLLYNADEDVLRVVLHDGRADPTANSNAALWSAVHHGLENAIDLLLADCRVVDVDAVVDYARVIGRGELAEKIVQCKKLFCF